MPAPEESLGRAGEEEEEEEERHLPSYAAGHGALCAWYREWFWYGRGSTLEHDE